MTDLLVRLMQLPRAQQRAIAWLLLLLVGVTIGLGLAAAISQIQEGRQQLAESTALLARNDAVIHSADRMGQRPETLIPAEFFRAPADPALQAGLQNILSSIVQQTHARIQSVANLEGFTRAGVRFVGIEASLKGDVAALSATVQSLETHQPPIQIEELSLTPDGMPSTELSMQASLYAIVAPGDNAGGAVK